MLSKDAIMDRIDELEDYYADMCDACEYAAASETQRTLADLYRALEYARWPYEGEQLYAR